MIPIAFLASTATLPGAAHRRDDAWQHDLEFAELVLGCRRAGIHLDAVAWDDARIAWGHYHGVVVGTTWDYTGRPDFFLERLEQIAGAVQGRVWNSPKLIGWNARKTYLAALSDAGAVSVPTVWLESCAPDLIAAAFDELATDELVIKPVIGAGAWRQIRLRRGGDLPPADQLPPKAAMAQPFLHGIVHEGEYSFLFFGERFSHALIKRPAPGDYRIQARYGGRETAINPSADDLAAAAEVIAKAPEAPLYARVDMARLDDGRLAVMELELIEPYFYVEQGRNCGDVFAAALLDRIQQNLARR